jgi:SepF-like predicted cell division protein (DUF552 family)
MKGWSLEDVNLGKVIGKIIGKIKKDEPPEEDKEVPSEIPATSEPSTPLPVSPPTPAPAPAPKPASTPAPSPPPPPQKKIYLKASPLHSLDDLSKIKAEVESGNIVIVKIGPLAQKSVEDVKKAVNELTEFAEKKGGDIARLGEDRVVVTPSFVRIWRETLSKGKTELSTEA